MRITRVNVKKTKRAGAIVGVASIVLDEAICVNNIEIIDGKHGLYISYSAVSLHLCWLWDLSTLFRARQRKCP